MFFESLQSLRGIFALIIFFHHFSFLNDGNPVFRAGGDLGVSFFFILSGFVMSQGYLAQEKRIYYDKKFPDFIAKRLSKIYPLHIVCLIAAVILQGFAFGMPELANLLLLQSWIPLENWYFSGNAVGWCLSDFLFFYLIFPFIGNLFHKHKNKFWKGFIILCLVYMLFIIPIIPASLSDGLIYISPITRILDFIFGIFLWNIYRTKTTKSLSLKWLNGLVVILFLILTVAGWYHLPTKYGLSIYWWGAIALLIIYSVDKSPKILNHPSLISFGDMSFTFYLIHVLVINYSDILISKSGISFPPIVRLILILSISLAATICVHKYFVVPTERLIRQRLDLKNTKSSNPATR